MNVLLHQAEKSLLKLTGSSAEKQRKQRFHHEFTNCNGTLNLLSDSHELSLLSLHKMLADLVSRELVSSSRKVVCGRKGNIGKQ